MKGLKEDPSDLKKNKEAADELLEELGVSSAPERCVLIIEDDKTALKLLEKLVKKMKFRVHAFEDPIEALKEAKNYVVELLFLDIKLPNINGLEFLNRLRKIQKKQDFPVVVVTGYTQKEMVTEILRHDVKGLLAKPLDLNRASHYLESFASKAKM